MNALMKEGMKEGRYACVNDECWDRGRHPVWGNQGKTGTTWAEVRIRAEEAVLYPDWFMS